MRRIVKMTASVVALALVAACGEQAETTADDGEQAVVIRSEADLAMVLRDRGLEGLMADIAGERDIKVVEDAKEAAADAKEAAAEAAEEAKEAADHAGH